MTLHMRQAQSRRQCCGTATILVKRSGVIVDAPSTGGSHRTDVDYARVHETIRISVRTGSFYIGIFVKVRMCEGRLRDDSPSDTVPVRPGVVRIPPTEKTCGRRCYFRCI